MKNKAGFFVDLLLVIAGSHIGGFALATRDPEVAANILAGILIAAGGIGLWRSLS